jgi:BNR/Asp-box repeat protein
VLAIGASLAAVRPARGAASESIRGRGIFQRGSLYLFANVHACGTEASLPAAQIFVSDDGGKTWSKRGPTMPGSDLEYVQASADGVWVAGLHTAEGPGTDPFLLVPTDAATSDWRVRTISEGPAELRGVARAGERALSAWIRRVDIHDKPFAKPDVTFHSDDRGETWKAQDERAPSPGSRMQRFARIGTRSGNWRIVDRQDGGFDLQHREKRGWQAVREFPWTTCEAPEPAP